MKKVVVLKISELIKRISARLLVSTQENTKLFKRPSRTLKTGFWTSRKSAYASLCELRFRERSLASSDAGRITSGSVWDAMVKKCIYFCCLLSRRNQLITSWTSSSSSSSSWWPSVLVILLIHINGSFLWLTLLLLLLFSCVCVNFVCVCVKLFRRLKECEWLLWPSGRSTTTATITITTIGILLARAAVKRFCWKAKRMCVVCRRLVMMMMETGRKQVTYALSECWKLYGVVTF